MESNVNYLFYEIWKFGGSIPNVVIGIFHLLYPSGRTMVLGSTKPLKEISTRHVTWKVKAAGP